MLFLHLLMVAPALLGLARADEERHGLEDLVHPAHMLHQEVGVVDFQKPMISFVLLEGPVANVLGRVPLLDCLFLLGLRSADFTAFAYASFR